MAIDLIHCEFPMLWCEILVNKVKSSVQIHFFFYVWLINLFFKEPDEDLDLAVRTIREAEEDALATVSPVIALSSFTHYVQVLLNEWN